MLCCYCTSVLAMLYMLSVRSIDVLRHAPRHTVPRARRARSRTPRGQLVVCSAMLASGGGTYGARISIRAIRRTAPLNPVSQNIKTTGRSTSRPHSALTAHPSFPPSPFPKHPDSPARRPAQARPSMSKQTQRNETKHPPNHPKTPSPPTHRSPRRFFRKMWGRRDVIAEPPLRHFRHLHVLHRRLPRPTIAAHHTLEPFQPQTDETNPKTIQNNTPTHRNSNNAAPTRHCRPRGPPTRSPYLLRSCTVPTYTPPLSCRLPSILTSSTSLTHHDAAHPALGVSLCATQAEHRMASPLPLSLADAAAACGVG
jgi:hypothetical protein